MKKGNGEKPAEQTKTPTELKFGELPDWYEKQNDELLKAARQLAQEKALEDEILKEE